MSLETSTVQQAFDLSSSPLAIAEFNVKQLLIKHANGAFTALASADAGALTDKDLLTLLERDDEDTIAVDEVRQLLVQHKPVTLNFQKQDDNFSTQIIETTLTPLPDSKLYAVSAKDVSQLRTATSQVQQSEGKITNLKARLEQLSKIDSLTGVYNPKAINHELSILFNSAKRNYGSFSILFIEIDKLDDIKAEHGERIQKKCIEHFAINLTRNFRRRSDIIIRYSSSQFLVCFAGANDAQTYNLADKILHAINNIPVIIEDSSSKINLGISIGMLNIVLNLDSNLDHTIGESNIACEKAKRLGGNQIHVAEIAQL